ncbi:MAG: DUF2306 domain-containing protein [Arenicella sp.]
MKVLVYLLSLGVAVYGVIAYAFLPLGSLVHPDMQNNFQAHAVGIYTHVFASALALMIGPFQFSARIRARYQQLHRRLGQLYLGLGVLLGGIAGLYLSPHAFGGAVSEWGFGTLAVVWLYTGIRAYLAVRKGEIDQHRKWMIRNFSLTFAAVTLRLYLPFPMLLGADFVTIYPIIAWLCWVPNLLFAELKYNVIK